MLPLVAASVLMTPQSPTFVEIVWPSRFSPKEEGVYESKVIRAGADWDELVLSWNAKRGAEGAMDVEARAVLPDRTTRWYSMGRWSLDETRRSSVKDQKDADGEVLTDVLRLAKPAREVQLRVRLEGAVEPVRIGLSFSRSEVSGDPGGPRKSAWGKLIDVPQRSQMSYPNGNVLCSPTSVSMVLWHWSNVLNRAELNVDVPELVKGVYDPGWSGTGNWSFNTAFAGSLPGMKAYVARLSSIAELEAWIEAGFPVVTSVSYDLLKGKGKRGGDDGHLVVLVGFGKDGAPIFNDPGKGKQVRQTYARSNFASAWAASRRTVYLIYPEDGKPPENAAGRWAR